MIETELQESFASGKNNLKKLLFKVRGVKSSPVIQTSHPRLQRKFYYPAEKKQNLPM
jgi:hypothetical protein